MKDRVRDKFRIAEEGSTSPTHGSGKMLHMIKGCPLKSDHKTMGSAFAFYSSSGGGRVIFPIPTSQSHPTG